MSQADSGPESGALGMERAIQGHCAGGEDLDDNELGSLEVRFTASSYFPFLPE